MARLSRVWSPERHWLPDQAQTILSIILYGCDRARHGCRTSASFALRSPPQIQQSRGCLRLLSNFRQCLTSPEVLLHFFPSVHWSISTGNMVRYTDKTPCPYDKSPHILFWNFLAPKMAWYAKKLTKFGSNLDTFTVKLHNTYLGNLPA